MLADLLATPGVVEQCELRSTSVGFMALHGGLEATTWELAQEAASRCDASLYGVVQPEDLTWHVPSQRYALSESKNLAAFCEHVDVAISLHGYGGVPDHPARWLTICVGGSGRPEASVLASALRATLPDYHVLDELDEIPPQYRGLHPDNPVNRTRRAGVQIELPPRVRGVSPIWSDHDFDSEPWTPHSASLLDALVNAAGELSAS
jgi:phage replication-related protein YjqB (UPF0714/DUF867 family)